MQQYQYRPHGVCAQQITFGLEGDKIHNVAFLGGCNGNLKAIGKLLEGADARETIDLLKGNTCGRRPTSCADQLATAVEQALAQTA